MVFGESGRLRSGGVSQFQVVSEPSVTDPVIGWFGGGGGV